MRALMMNYHALLSALLFLIAFIAPAAVSAYHLDLLDCHRSIHPVSSLPSLKLLWLWSLSQALAIPAKTPAVCANEPIVRTSKPAMQCVSRRMLIGATAAFAFASASHARSCDCTGCTGSHARPCDCPLHRDGHKSSHEKAHTANCGCASCASHGAGCGCGKC
jgi:hypothetical protein